MSQHSRWVSSASGHVVLDGVPFKIVDNFKPPVQLPSTEGLRFGGQSGSAVLKSEYTFGNETRYVAWYKQQASESQERLAERQKAAAKRRQQKEAEEAAAAVSAAAIISDASQSTDGNSAHSLPSAAAAPPLPTSRPVPLLPTLAPGMLMPKPARRHQNISELDGAVRQGKTNVDLAMFEREVDVFDKVELKTLNDFEELKSVLQEAQLEQYKSQHKNGAATTTVLQAAASSSRHGGSNEHSASSVNEAFECKPPSPAKLDGQQVQNGKVPAVSYAAGQNDRVPARPKSHSTSDWSTAPSETSGPRTPARPTDPPLPKPRPGSGIRVPTVSSKKELAVAVPVSEATASSTSKPTPPPKPSVHANKPGVAASKSPSGGRPFSYTSGVSLLSPTKSPRGSSASSVKNIVWPDLVTVDNGKPGASTAQDAHTSSAGSTSAASIAVSTVAELSKNQSNHEKEASMLTDSPAPGTSMLPGTESHLPSTAALTNKLVTMGFPRLRVETAIEEIGNNDKKVIEHLCTLDELVEKGHDWRIAQRALLAYPGQETKVLQYLVAYKRLLEYGFDGGKIQQALIAHDVNAEQALDTLATSS